MTAWCLGCLHPKEGKKKKPSEKLIKRTKNKNTKPIEGKCNELSSGAGIPNPHFAGENLLGK